MDDNGEDRAGYDLRKRAFAISACNIVYVEILEFDALATMMVAAQVSTWNGLKIAGHFGLGLGSGVTQSMYSSTKW